MDAHRASAHDWRTPAARHRDPCSHSRLFSFGHPPSGLRDSAEHTLHTAPPWSEYLHLMRRYFPLAERALETPGAREDQDAFMNALDHAIAAEEKEMDSGRLHQLEQFFRNNWADLIAINTEFARYVHIFTDGSFGTLPVRKREQIFFDAVRKELEAAAHRESHPRRNARRSLSSAFGSAGASAPAASEAKAETLTLGPSAIPSEEALEEIILSVTSTLHKVNSAVIARLKVKDPSLATVERFPSVRLDPVQFIVTLIPMVVVLKAFPNQTDYYKELSRHPPVHVQLNALATPTQPTVPLNIFANDYSKRKLVGLSVVSVGIAVTLVLVPPIAFMIQKLAVAMKRQSSLAWPVEIATALALIAIGVYFLCSTPAVSQRVRPMLRK